ncbi:hypothetical protein Riv7116_5637 [Rivularia sp. PCC 7116]|uniref:Spy/CpxP family protein refolding chaperone n=1 Tax=Rivularia sp. PCC 7116 TaxID=373994 RepID=UPI00029F496D|nr:Spy/CpxP family protein refolding chaperone [Rivularia sp. PCC 7116]AFY58005.1 hypothetical protein Riv7116_5637 [Rivularia sp. PCC 7116]
MKAQLISALIATTIIGATASISNAQIPSAPRVNIQMENGVPSIPGIEFSDEQKEKLKEVNQEARSRMSEILTSEQQDDLRAAVDAGTNPQEAIKTLNLSNKQKNNLEKVQKWQRKQVLGILDNEQKRKIMQMRQRQGRQVGSYRLNIR